METEAALARRNSIESGRLSRDDGTNCLMNFTRESTMFNFGNEQFCVRESRVESSFSYTISYFLTESRILPIYLQFASHVLSAVNKFSCIMTTYIFSNETNEVLRANFTSYKPADYSI